MILTLQRHQREPVADDLHVNISAAFLECSKMLLQMRNILIGTSSIDHHVQMVGHVRDHQIIL